VQDDELIAANFFTANQLPRLPPHGTIARHLIELSFNPER
jgi:NAD+ diphosphatase